jgi:hypothetical protein
MAAIAPLVTAAGRLPAITAAHGRRATSSMAASVAGSRMQALADAQIWTSFAAGNVMGARTPSLAAAQLRHQSAAAAGATSAAAASAAAPAGARSGGVGKAPATGPAAAAGSPAAAAAAAGLFGQSFGVGAIHAIPRAASGSRSAQWARMHGLIPGIVYGYDAQGRDAVDLVYVREADLRREVNKRGPTFMNTLYDM